MARLVGDVRARSIRSSLVLPRGEARAHVSRAELSLALAGLLFDDVQERVPAARAYVLDAVRAGRPLVFDHGALRTVAAPSGDLPTGAAAVARFLEPLGYRRAGTYPLEKLGMTGHAYAHEDLPEEIPQYFVSELHPERFSSSFQSAVQRVIGTSQDPLGPRSLENLERLGSARQLPFEEAAGLLTELVATFGRHHAEPSLADYETLLAESAEMAWIATEGSAFNHATDRVEDVFAVAAEQKRLGRPVKAAVEISTHENVMQTAFRAAPTQRLFRSAEGHMIVREVPGSFHEFITRKRLLDGTLDLTFDAGNATSIFKMTSKDAGGGDARSA